MLCFVQPNKQTRFLSLWRCDGIKDNKPHWVLLSAKIPYEIADTRFRDAVIRSYETDAQFFPETREVSGRWIINPLNSEPVAIPYEVVRDCLRDGDRFPVEQSKIDFSAFWRKYRRQEVRLNPEIKQKEILSHIQKDLRANPGKFPAWLVERQRAKDQTVEAAKKIKK